jgi:pyruvate/2-oxoglutarate dehydrogenase complex dihydrolipoamide acyltransferase (E2) component
VKEDQPIVEVMTDKATVEIGSPVDGEVLQLLVKEGQTVPVGATLLVLGARRGAGAAPAPSHAPAHAAPARPAEVPRPTAATMAAAAGEVRSAAAPQPVAALSETGLPSRSDGTRRVRAAPATRRFARELGVDIAQLEGTGPNGRVTVHDVRGAVGSARAPQRQAAAAMAASAPAAPPAPPAPPAPAPRVAPAPAAPAASPAPRPASTAPRPAPSPLRPHRRASRPPRPARRRAGPSRSCAR